MVEKRCTECRNTKGNFIEKEGIANRKAYFCDNNKCYENYKKKSEESGVCEFC